ncbi:hypothetical protein BGZ57DRAFT_939940 [Hyaloscypha finlandica]|nr:hypothetical protein BGZ57DRAFT_939940 [Hyaloscypha finlandica]
MRRNDRPQCFMVELMKETRLYVSGFWKDIEACVDFFQNSGSKYICSKHRWYGCQHRGGLLFNPAAKTCSRCWLVQYYSRERQLSHRPRHKSDCNSPPFVGKGVEQLSPHGQRKYLWGMVPAVDILNVAQNAGANISLTLHLLFAASGDLRNVAKTLTQLLDQYTGQREVVINDKGFDIVARNATLLLAAILCLPEKALEVILHIWYSKSVRDELRAYLEVPAGLSKTKAQKTMDYIERVLYAKLSAWRPGMLKFRKEGPLLPYGAPIVLFNVPNPTFFQSNDFWSMMDSASPLEVWPIKEIMATVPVTKNHLHGRLYYLDSNIVDQRYLGTEKTLPVFTPLLKQKSQNPYVAILSLYLNAPKFRRVLDYFPSVDLSVLSNSNPVNNCKMVKVAEARTLVRDFNALFSEHAEEQGFDKNTIVEKWPLRLKSGASKENFNILLSSDHIAGEKHVEWER